MITPEALRTLASLNLSPEQMAGVLGVLADGIEKEQERKRKQAERKRKSRDSHGTVTGQSCDTPPQGFDGFPDPSLIPISPTKENPPKGGQKKNPPQLPDWLPKAEWEQYVEMRNRIRKPMTANAVNGAISRLEKFMQNGHDPAKILENSIFNSHQGLFEPRENNGKSSKHKDFDKQDYLAGSEGFDVAGRTAS